MQHRDTVLDVTKIRLTNVPHPGQLLQDFLNPMLKTEKGAITGAATPLCI